MSRPRHLHQADQACADIAAAGQPVTFTAVAARVGIGRATLYRDRALRAVVEDQRQRAASASTITGLAADIAALRTAIEAVAARVRRHEEQLRQLKRASTRTPRLPRRPRRRRASDRRDSLRDRRDRRDTSRTGGAAVEAPHRAAPAPRPRSPQR